MLGIPSSSLLKRFITATDEMIRKVDWMVIQVANQYKAIYDLTKRIKSLEDKIDSLQK